MLKISRRLITSGLLLLVTALPLSTHAGETLQRVVDFQVLKVGMSGNQPPMTMRNREGGVMGYDVDLAQALARAMRVQLDIKVMPFGELMTALEKDEIDMIISGMSITPERTEHVSFVGPYLMSGKSILTRNAVLAKTQDSGQFNRADLKLLALENSTSADFARMVAPEAQLVEVKSYDEGVEALKNGKADAMIADMTVCQLSVLRYPDAGLVTLEKPLTVEPLGIAISKDDPQFLNLVDNYLDAYGKTGILAAMRKKWFEDGSWVAALP